MRYLKNLEVGDEICTEPIARYYELGSELKEALSVRDRELVAIAKKGMLHRSCRVQIEVPAAVTYRLFNPRRPQ